MTLEFAWKYDSGAVDDILGRRVAPSPGALFKACYLTYGDKRRCVLFRRLVLSTSGRLLHLQPRIMELPWRLTLVVDRVACSFTPVQQ